MRRGQRQVALFRRRRALLGVAHAETAAFLARHVSLPDALYVAAYDDLFGRLKVGRINGSNLLGAFDVFYVRAAPNLATALLNLVAATHTAALSANAPTFHAGYGFATNGLDSYVEWGGWSPAAGVQFQQNSATLGFWSRNPDNKGAAYVAGTIGGSATIATRNAANVEAYRINQVAGSNGAATTDASGFFAAVRSASNVTRMFKNGAQSGADGAVVSAARSAAVVREGNSNASFAEDQLPFAFAGRALTAAEIADLHDALSAYLTAIGWQPLAVVAAPTTVTPAATFTNVPDIAGSTANTGYTCVGLARDAIDGTWWSGSFGRFVQGDTTSAFAQTIVHLAADPVTGGPGTTVLANIDPQTLSTPMPATGIQGVAFDPHGNGGQGAVWFVQTAATPANCRVVCIDRNGAYLSHFVPAFVVNGLAYDTLRQLLILGGNDGRATWLNKDGTTPAAPRRILTAVPGGIDQIAYRADVDAVLVTTGGNGNSGLVFRVGLTDQDYGAPRVSRYDSYSDVRAIEGMVDHGGRWWFANDGYYHAPPANTRNTFASVARPY